MKILACTVFCSAFYRSSLPLPKEIKGITIFHSEHWNTYLIAMN